MLSRNFLSTLLLSTLLCAALPAVAGPRYAITALPVGTNPTGINSAGQIVGDIGVEGGGRRAFTWSAGTLVQYGNLGGSDSTALAINDSGRIIGYASDASGDARAFTGSGGALTDLNVFGGAVSSYGNAINNNGQVAGAFNTTGGMGRAFTRNGAGDIDLGTLGGGFAVANGINSAGDIVGFSSLDDTSPFLAHAFLYSGGVMQDLGTMAGASLSEATAINDSEQIAAYGCRGDECGAVRLDLAAPIPEPGTLAIFAAGLMLLGWRRYTGRQMDNIARQMRPFSPH